MLNWVRGQVSKKKRRVREGHFDLDLSYIGDRIIAMGYPAQGFEKYYRNDFNDVKEFLDEKHGDNYMVYNLCSERSYDPEAFSCRVESYPFDDHNPPAFDMIRQFCLHAADWLAQSASHVVAVHCKAGKGRTGTMICCLLLFLREFERSDDALHFYAEKRTLNEKGVTIPSQIRYVHYFEQYFLSGARLDAPFAPRECVLTKVVFRNVPSAYNSKDLYLQIDLMGTEIAYEVKRREADGAARAKDSGAVAFSFDDSVPPLKGDFRIAALKSGKICWFMWFNSEFIKDNETFSKSLIDKASKSNKFSDDFCMEVYCHR